VTPLSIVDADYQELRKETRVAIQLRARRTSAAARLAQKIVAARQALEFCVDDVLVLTPRIGQLFQGADRNLQRILSAIEQE